jgi:hypothetical protein
MVGFSRRRPRFVIERHPRRGLALTPEPALPVRVGCGGGGAHEILVISCRRGDGNGGSCHQCLPTKAGELQGDARHYTGLLFLAGCRRWIRPHRRCWAAQGRARCQGASEIKRV